MGFYLFNVDVLVADEAGPGFVVSKENVHLAAAVDGQVRGVHAFFAEEDEARVVTDVGMGEEDSFER